MDTTFGSRLRGSRAAVCSLVAAAMVYSHPATAETIFTVNGVDVDSAVVDLYFNSRLQNQGGQATPEQREILMSELRDIYILATQENAEALAADERIAAQLDLQARSILAQAVATEILSNIEVSEDELQAEYDQQVEVAPPLQYKARHILVATEDAAKDLIAQLQGGADFAELAKQHSTGPSGKNGGDLGWFEREQMVPPFSEATTKLEKNTITKEPVKTQFGWHVIRLEDKRESPSPKLDDVKQELTTQLQRERAAAYMRTARKQVKVEIQKPPQNKPPEEMYAAPGALEIHEVASEGLAAE